MVRLVLRAVAIAAVLSAMLIGCQQQTATTPPTPASSDTTPPTPASLKEGMATYNAKMRADQLMWQCEASKDTLKGATDLTYCAGYIAGITDMNAILPALHLPKIFCLPGKNVVSNDRLRLIFLKWARQRPADLHYSARASVLVAVSETFPCKK